MTSLHDECVHRSDGRPQSRCLLGECLRAVRRCLGGSSDRAYRGFLRGVLRPSWGCEARSVLAGFGSGGALEAAGVEVEDGAMQDVRLGGEEELDGPGDLVDRR